MNRVEEFLAIAEQFKLGHLTTESPHSHTLQLSQLSQTNTAAALNVLHDVDVMALKTMREKVPVIFLLSQEIEKVLGRGDKVFLVGCGATGRLSLVLETLSLQMNHYKGQIISLMAGGDFALIRSVESFEDHASYGARQLMGLGFKQGDLLLAITEGGETPFVIGACNQAAEVSRQSPWFLYCNPDSALMGLQRCREVLENDHIQKLNLTCGPMALTGSTRMQASSVQMFAAGLALLYQWKSVSELSDKLDSYLDFHQHTDVTLIESFVLAEAQDHEKNMLTTYLSHRDLAISVLTDTTERAPTFSQPGFENDFFPAKISPIYLSVQGTHSAAASWQALLSRQARCLDWSDLPTKVNEAIFMGFDISEKAILRRRGSVVEIALNPSGIGLKREGLSVTIPVFSAEPLFVHMTLKMTLNMLSTTMMGRRGFYLDNIMTWVRPSNYKLIDRATRYVQTLAARRGVSIGYEAGVKFVIEMMEREPSSAVVMRVLEDQGIKI
jgi:N-acetylmuramic acid 6-phosphate etherase